MYSTLCFSIHPAPPPQLKHCAMLSTLRTTNSLSELKCWMNKSHKLCQERTMHSVLNTPQPHQSQRTEHHGVKRAPNCSKHKGHVKKKQSEPLQQG